MGPRLNRYYTNLKPFYRIDKTEADLPTDTTLQFESRFESGNLRKAVKVSSNEYELYLKNDYNT